MLTSLHGHTAFVLSVILCTCSSALLLSSWLCSLTSCQILCQPVCIPSSLAVTYLPLQLSYTLLYIPLAILLTLPPPYPSPSLTQMKHLSNPTLSQQTSSTSQPGDGDNVSMASNVTAEEDATMQGAFMGLVSRKTNLIPILNLK